MHAPAMPRAAIPVLIALILLGCGAEEPPTPRAPAAPQSGVAEPPGHTPPSSPFVPVRPPSDDSLLEAPARALPGEGSVEQIAAAYPLRVVRVRAQPGDQVSPGDPLVEVTSAEVLSAAATYRSAGESLSVASARLAAVRSLRDSRAATAEQVFELESRVASERGRRLEALAVLRAAGIAPGEVGSLLGRGVIVLRSERGGVVRALHATPGEVHPDGQTFGAVVTGSSRRIEARFPSPLGDGFRFEFEDLLGRRHALGPRPSRTLEAGDEGGVLVWFDIAADAELAPDAPGHVHAIAVDSSFVEVPVGALHPIEGSAEVLRRRADAVSRVRVRVIASSGSSAIVAGDLRLGDEVASDASGMLNASAGDEP